MVKKSEDGYEVWSRAIASEVRSIEVDTARNAVVAMTIAAAKYFVDSIESQLAIVQEQYPQSARSWGQGVGRKARVCGGERKANEVEARGRPKVFMGRLGGRGVCPYTSLNHTPELRLPARGHVKQPHHQAPKRLTLLSASQLVHQHHTAVTPEYFVCNPWILRATHLAKCNSLKSTL